jgi:thiol-disulfide isomerase/thioredoxin
MAVTPSTMLPLGTPLPPIVLRDLGGAPQPLDARGPRGLLVMFVSVHCPFVVHVRPALGPLADDLAALGIACVGVHSNDVAAYPADAADAVAALAAALGWRFPQRMDSDQEAARALSAACTPDFFLFDADGRLVYRGQLDDSRPGRGTPTAADVRDAAARLVAGDPPRAEQRPSQGCNIKWKPGNAPPPTGWLAR